MDGYKGTFKVQKTNDGSATLYNSQINESYHSKHGALQEANHVYINAGLNQMSKAEVSVLEFGFGTGLNFGLSVDHCLNKGQELKYTSLELYPVPSDDIEALNYSAFFENSVIYKNAINAKWNVVVDFGKIELCKMQTDFFDFQAKSKFDVIYYDAFGPRVQPDLWEDDWLIKVASWINEGGCLVTYCSKGTVKRAFQSIGLMVEKLPGPPGKREMLRVWKK